MKTIQLKQIDHSMKPGDEPGAFEPTVFDDTILVDENRKVVGFYLREAPEPIGKLATIADVELRSSRVPKSKMGRYSGFSPGDKSDETRVFQYSCITGSVPPRPHCRRPYPQRSSVHNVRSADMFVRAMSQAGKRMLELIRDVDAELYATHREAVERRVPNRWRWSDLYTSSISNVNIAATYHRDRLNVRGSVNTIIAKRKNSTGGSLVVPDYGLCFAQTDGSVLVYPAWRNIHAVTPIVPTHRGGYRNALVWYALDQFGKYP